MKEPSDMNLSERTHYSIYELRLLLDGLGRDLNGQNFEKYLHLFFDLFQRFRINLTSINELLDLYFSDPRFKLSVNLILRSICSDTLTLLYLLSFYDDKDPELTGLQNEFHILDAEHLRFVKAMFELEERHNATFGTRPPKDRQPYFKNLAPHLLDENFKIKSKKKLRESTPPFLIDSKLNAGKMISENQKFEHILSRISDKTTVFSVFHCYKYYTQFAHFNFRGKDLLKSEHNFDIFQMNTCISNMIRSILILFSMAKIENKQFMEKSSKLLKFVHETNEIIMRSS